MKKLKKSVADLVREAEAEIARVNVDQLRALQSDPQVQIVDIRDVRELTGGTIEGAIHAPRCMLEFWVDPESPYYKPVFGTDKTFVLFCGGGWRSALAAKNLQDMGFGPVKDLIGGFGAWKEAGAPIAEKCAPMPKA
jgi:rhodanese-related sulfurtransferase